jgi:SAM-dependent methyltransferase
MDEALDRVYAARFDARVDDRVLLWETLCDAYFQQFVGPDDAILDVAAGYCEFINAVRAGRKIAVDLNPNAAQRAGSDVEVVRCRSSELPAELDGQLDVVWVSNFLEHLRDSEELLDTLTAINRVLREGGRLLVLQPNIRLTKEAYWDFIDHSLPITEKRLAEALQLTGFTIETMRVRFLPYTADSRRPIVPSLIRLYLKLPPAQWLLGKQSFVVARKRAQPPAS